MYTPTLLTFALLALSNLTSVSATPPACLLAAINVQTNPSDLKSLCGTLENAVVGNVTEKCMGGAYQEAVKAYEATCLEEAGVTISITSSSSSASTTKTGAASGSITATASGSGAKITGSGSATGTSGSTVSATGSASSASGTTAEGGAGTLIIPGLLGLVGLVGAVLL
ncbi:hypothetical protein SBOR_9354 [Sclerotinia borealis F-4128]|uniref:Gpi anchored cell wall protein n=1 Tax=Sclerotinia borealis (strain F-4128) TaxID=1432307 RepID=W9C3G2_SCLBF|nr:hypothetical protein SBOR_9354 [Sclerotinia borealis F-4128]